MRISDIGVNIWRLARTKWRPYLLLLLVSIPSTLLTIPLEHWTRSLFIFYLPMILYAITRYSYGPCFFAIGLTALLTDVVILSPQHNLLMSHQNYVREAFFLVTLSVATWAILRKRESGQRAFLRQRQLLDAAEEPMLMLDEQGRITFWNKGAERLYGFTREEAMGSSPAGLLSSIYPKARAAIFEELKRDGSWHGQLMRTSKSGAHLTVESVWTLAEDGGILQTDHDITRRNAMEEELRKTSQVAHERLADYERVNRMLNALSRCNHAVVHASSQTALLQEAVNIIYNYGHYEIVWVGLPEELPERRVRIAAVSGNATDLLDDIRIQWDESPNGRGPTGMALRSGCIVLSEDVSKDSNFEAWRAQSWARHVGSAISIPMRMRDRVAAVLTVYARETNAFNQVEINLLTELAGDLSFGMEMMNTRQQVDEERKSRLLLEDQFRQAQKMEAIGQLAGGIAHDFNNLLMVVIANAEHLLGQSDSPEIRQRAQGILQASESASSLTHHLLAFSRKQVLQPTVQTLNAIVVNFREMLPRTLPENIEVDLRLCNDPWTTRVDRSQVEQILMNLVVNARDAMPEGGRLIIESDNVVIDASKEHHPLAPTGDYVRLSVRDTGVGMDAAMRARIFDPFFTTKREGKGSGLGLSTVYGIVQQSKGYIWVDSEPSVGTSFEILFPRVLASPKVGKTHHEPAPQPVAAPSLPAPDAPEPVEAVDSCLLVVEDDKQLRSLLCDYLASSGHHVLQAADGESAMAQAFTHQNSLQLVLSDLTLPDIGGRELLERLRAVQPEIEAILMSGRMPEEDEHEIFLQKPFPQAALHNAIREAMSRRGGRMTKATL